MARILVVDDSVAIRSSIELILSQHGYHVIAKENGREALNFAREEAVELVITDLNMPEMNGMSLVSNLRIKEAYKLIPILIMTTETADYKKKKAKSLGATGWIAKPFDEERLLKAVRKVLGQ